MEYVEGTPIDQYARNHRLTVAERLSLFCTVCSAIQYAHQSLVVHRDIKPTNIMVTADGTPKLLDFGIAKVLSRDFGEMRALTMIDERPMTPDFASPEQVRGEPVTTSSDVYALGILLFEMLTGGGHPLHYAYKKLGYDRAVLEAEPERPSVVAARLEADTPDIPEGSPEKLRNRLQGDLDAIVLMALRKEPQRRYVSVQHFADDVHRYLQGAPVRAQRDTVGYRTRKFVTRHKAGVLAAAVAVLALIASSIISYSYYRVAAEQRRRAEARTCGNWRSSSCSISTRSLPRARRPPGRPLSRRRRSTSAAWKRTAATIRRSKTNSFKAT
jgi:serine/threonine protein kinase